MRPRRYLAATTAITLAACAEPTTVSDSSTSTFTADVRGAINERLTGSAAASSGDWQRVFQVTLPDVGTFSGIALAAANGVSTISFFRSGTDLPVGTFRIGRAGGSTPRPSSGGYSAGYVVKRTDGLQLFVADSGTLTIAQTGSRVTGTFTFFAKHYDVIPNPTAESSGKPITPISSGEAPVSVTGTFDASRR